ncbi:MAG: flagellar hook protein FlgE [Myxococcota bacterium]
MGLTSALFTSVSGLDATGTAIAVIGDNIANVNTTGYKASRAEFSDILGRMVSGLGGFSQIGAGTTISGVTPIFSQGTFESTTRTTDLAIEGQGFFVLDGGQGRFYSRAGVFTFDQSGALVNPAGLRVQGFTIDPATGQSTQALGDIQISSAVSPPRATTAANVSVNLDANSLTLGVPFDPADPNTTSNFRTLMTVYDSIGNDHLVTYYFTKSAANNWEWTASVPSADTTTAPANPGDSLVVQGSGTLTFDSNGVLQAATGSPVTFEFSGGATAGQSVNLGFGPIGGVGTGEVTTQFAGPSTTNSFNQDGFATGQIQGIQVDREGFVVGQFSNGETLTLAEVALASFPNAEGLVKIGSGNLVETRRSGQPSVGAPLTGRLGSIRSNSLEQSNVDLAREFVQLIINQRAFQANARTVSTTNELMANLVSLGQ